MTAHQTNIATPALVHDIDHNDVQQVSHGGGDAAWVASCTCGEFTCKPQGSPEDARREVYQHVRKMFRRIEKASQAQRAGILDGQTLRSGLQAIVDTPGPVTKSLLIALLAAHPSGE